MADEAKNKWYKSSIKKIKKIKFKKHINKVETATIKHAHKFLIKRWSNFLEVQRNIIFWILIVGALILATGFQFAWYQDNYKQTAVSNDGTYAEAVLGPINTLNPIFASTSAEQSASSLLFSRLFRYDTTGHLNNDLVSDLSVDKTNKIYTVKLRNDVKWHDGEELNANDVEFTINLIKNPNTRSSITGWDDVSIKVVDDYTVQFTLQSVYAAFEHALTFPVLPKHILSDVLPANLRENDFSKNPIGSGPFALRLVQTVETNKDREVVYLTRNDNYHGGRLGLARFQLHVYQSREEILKALSQNEVNAAADLLPSDIANVNGSRYSALDLSTKSGVYALLNNKSPILKDTKVRTALRYATDKSAILEKLPASAGALDLPFLNGQISGTKFDVPKNDTTMAQKILDEAGWKKGSDGIRKKSGQELKLSVVTMKDSEFEAVLEVMASQWRSIGVIVETRIVDPSDVSQNVAQTILQPRDYDVLVYRLSIGADPDVYAYWHSSQASDQGSNFSNYSNIISDDALSTARSGVDPELRKAKYITFANQWIKDVPAIGLYQSTTQYVYSNKIKSLNKDVVLISPIDRYSDIMDWSVGTRTVYKTP